MRVPSRDFFAGAPSKSMRLVILLLIGVSKQELMIFFLRSAECCFHSLHSILYNTIVVGSWINFRLSICCFVIQYIVVFSVIWSCSYKRSSNMFFFFLLNEVIEVHWFLRWHHLCRVRPYHPHGSQWLTVNNCPCRDFTQRAKSRGGTLVTRAKYILTASTYTWSIQSVYARK